MSFINKELCIDKNNIDDLIISSDQDNKVISRYKDDIWDLSCRFTTFHHQAKKLIFSKLDHNMKKEIKWLAYLLLKEAVSFKGQRIKASTLILYYQLCLKKLAYYAHTNNCTVFTILEKENHLKKYLYQLERPSHYVCFGAVLNHINNLGKELTTIKVINIKYVQKLVLKAKKDSQYNQHPVIPFRIYSSVINNLWSIVQSYDDHSKELHQVIIAVSNNRNLANFCWEPAPDRKNFIRFIKKYHLYDFVNKYNIKCIKELVKHFKYVQNSCKYLIHIYTGMRDAEVLNLKSTCFNKEKSGNGYIATIEGETTKLVPNSVIVKWVTSPNLEQVIDVLKDILKLTMTVSGKDNVDLLFLTTGYFGLATGKPSKSNNVQRFSQRYCPSVLFSNDLIILEEDIQELEKIDPFRGWLNDPRYGLGKKWQINSHQFRRSLAVYSAQSGLVSLPSMKRQLKHVTKEMTLYYAKNSSRTKDFLGISSNTPKHFFHYFHHVKAETDAVSYINNVLLSEETLLGGHGNWIENDKINQNIVVNRQKTIERFKKGEIAYQETPLGGCATITACDKKVMRSVTACITCSKAIIKESKLKKIIDQTLIFINTLEKDSVEYKIERDHIDILLSFQQRQINTHE